MPGIIEGIGQHFGRGLSLIQQNAQARLEQPALQNQQTKLENQGMEQGLQSQKLQQAAQMMNLINSAVSAADNMGLERGSAEHTGAVSLILNQQGLPQEMVQGFSKMKLGPVRPYGQTPEQLAQSNRQSLDQKNLMEVSPGASVYNPTTKEMVQAPDRARPSYKQYFNKEGQSQYFDVSSVPPDANEWSAVDPTKQSLANARADKLTSDTELNTKKAELIQAQTEFANAKTQTEKEMLQSKIGKLQSEIDENIAQTAFIEEKGQRQFTKDDASILIKAMDSITTQQLLNSENGKAKDVNAAEILAGRLNDVSGYLYEGLKKTYGSEAANLAAQAIAGGQIRKEAKQSKQAVTDMGDDKGNVPMTFEQMGITDTQTQVDFTELEKQVKKVMPDFDLAAQYQKEPENFALLFKVMREGIKDPKTGLKRKLTTKEIIQVLTGQ